MLTDKGPAYVVAWPHELAARTGLSVEYVADALNAVINSDVPATRSTSPSSPESPSLR